MNLEDLLLKAPCVFCGYNGKEFYQERTHASACPYYSVGGLGQRKEMIVPFLIDIVKQYMVKVAEKDKPKDGKIVGKLFILYDGRAKTGGYDAASVYVTAPSLGEAVKWGADESFHDGIWYEWDEWGEDGEITLINPVARWDLPPANKREDL